VTEPALEQTRRDWEDLAEVDPYWAIAGNADLKYGGWDQEEFFRSGERVVADVMAVGEELGHPTARGAALDFGCGYGRLTRALAGRFNECVGLDISGRMVQGAREMNAAVAGASFEVNERPDLRLFADERFDLILAKSVLGHSPSREVVLGYVTEFVRCLRPGGLAVFQAPNAMDLRHRIQHHRRIYLALRRLGLSPEFLYRRLRTSPMQVIFVPEREVLDHLATLGVTVLDVRDNRKRPVPSSTYYVTR